MANWNRWIGLAVLLLLALPALSVQAEETSTAASASPPAASAAEVQPPKESGTPEGETLAPASVSEDEGEIQGTYHAYDPANFFLSIGPGLLLWNENAGASLDLVAAVRLSKTVPLYFGADLGYNYFRMNTSTTGVVVNGIQVLPTIFYEWEISHVTRFHPYAGIAAGVNVLSVSATGNTPVKPTFIVQPGRYTAGEFLFKPGIRIDISREVSFTTELRWGVLKADMLVSPETSLVFTL